MSVVGAIMVPHPPLIHPQVGRGSEKQIETTIRAYEQAADFVAALKPETLVIASPHATMYGDYFHISPGRSAMGSFSRFGAPEAVFEERYDVGLVEAISSLAEERRFPAGTLGERDRRLDHGTMIPLYFIRQKYSDFKIVRIGLSGLPLTTHYALGVLIRDAAAAMDRRVVFVASGDLSHKLQESGPYGYVPEGPQYDERIMDVCGRAAFGELFDFSESFCDKAAECGHRSFVMMAGTFDGLSVKAEKLSHEDVTGVGYGICTFTPGEPDENRHFLSQVQEKLEEELSLRKENEDDYVRLARQTIDHYILNNEVLPQPKALPAELKNNKAGVFVSIHKQGRLRGCIGTILPVTGCIAEEIIRNAISAATQDPRFDRIAPEELKWLEISVDVLGKPERVEGIKDLDPKRYGVIVTCGRKRGLLLPDLDGIDTAEEQVMIARQKGGISETSPVVLERFEVIRHY